MLRRSAQLTLMVNLSFNASFQDERKPTHAALAPRNKPRVLIGSGLDNPTVPWSPTLARFVLCTRPDSFGFRDCSQPPLIASGMHKSHGKSPRLLVISKNSRNKVVPGNARVSLQKLSEEKQESP